MRASGPVSGGESTRDSKGRSGVAQAAGGLVTLEPIMILAAEVTIALYVAVVVTEETIEEVKRNRKLESMCHGYH